MSFPRYAEYKPSGVEWLGQVPAHWTVRPLKNLTTRISSGKTPLGGNETYVDEGIPFLRSQNVYDDGLRLDDVAHIAPAVDQSMAGSRVVARDILINITGASIGRSCIVPTGFPSANVNQHVCVVRVEGGDLVEFCAWFLKCSAVKAQIDFAQDGAAREGLTFEQIGGFRVPLPDPIECKQISTFLDHETAKIDALVAEQQKLIALLKEKRQAVISHAVTKGLNPHAPMKPSGIEWLGDVPAHWATPPLYLRYAVELGKMLDTSKISGDHLMPYLRNIDVQWGRINLEDLPQMDIAPSEQDRFSVREGDLLVCEGGEVGRAAVVKGLSASVGYQKALHRLRKLLPDECSTYLFYVFRWAVATGMFSVEGQSTIAHLTGEQLRKYRFPKPPFSEQASIVSFLDEQTATFDALMIAQERAITLLKERRSALISAAVTGQIDVRGLAPAVAAEARAGAVL